MRKGRERDLAAGAPAERFGDAIMRCEGFTPDCATYGRCMNDGDCFASPPHLVAARMVASLIPTDGRAGQHLAYLRKVVDMLREGRVVL